MLIAERIAIIELGPCNSVAEIIQFFRSSYLANPALAARSRTARAWELQSSKLESGRPLRSA